MIPQRAVTELQGNYRGGRCHQRLSSLNIVSIRRVHVRPADEQYRGSSSTGLKAGDSIIVEGLQKVRAAMKVNPHPVTILGQGQGMSRFID